MRLSKKYLLTLSAITVLSATTLVGCSSKKDNDTVNDAATTPVVTEEAQATPTQEAPVVEESASQYVDGTYTRYAAEADNGYTYFVSMDVENGAIVSVVWDANDADGNSKKSLAENGSYVMTEDGPLWSEQSESLCQFVVDHQSLDNLTTIDDEGHTDVVAGVSIKINPFIELAEGCIEDAIAGNTSTGAATTTSYVDGTYTSVAAEADNGYTYAVNMTVENGAIVSMDWDATDADGNSKKALAESGQYTMTEDGPLWSEQSESLCQFVIDNQSLDNLTTIDDEGHTDVVAGVSIKINPFIELAEECISQATAQ